MGLINDQEFTNRLRNIKTVRDLMLLQADLRDEMSERLRLLANHVTASVDLNISAPETEAIELISLLPVVIEQAVPAVHEIHCNYVSPDDIEAVMRTVEEQNRFVNALYMNARDYADLRKFGREVLDFETRTAMVHAGALVKVYGAQVMVNKDIPAGWIYVVSLPIGDKPLLIQKVHVVRVPPSKSSDPVSKSSAPT